MKHIVYGWIEDLKSKGKIQQKNFILDLSTGRANVQLVKVLKISGLKDYVWSQAMMKVCLVEKKQSFEPVNTKRKAQNRTDKKRNRDLQGQTTGKTHKHHIQRTLDGKNSEISSKEVEKIETKWEKRHKGVKDYLW